MYTRSKYKLFVQGFKFEVSVQGTSSVVVVLTRIQYSNTRLVEYSYDHRSPSYDDHDLKH